MDRKQQSQLDWIKVGRYALYKKFKIHARWRIETFLVAKITQYTGTLLLPKDTQERQRCIYKKSGTLLAPADWWNLSVKIDRGAA
jgi:hypothetical protein